MIRQANDIKTVRCAIYTRKSHEEGLQQEFNSLDAQRESCEAYIASQRHEGWVALPARYDDGGFSGGNMDRPALKRLLADIEAGRVDVVLVYKGQNYPGEHEAIIDRKTWDRVQAILGENRNYRAHQTRRKTAAILKGIIRCGCCDAAMAPIYTTRRGKRYHYYVCHAAGKNSYDTCEVKSVPAGQIEGAVFTYLREIFADPEMVARTFRATCAQVAEDRKALSRQKGTLEKRLSELRKAIGRLVHATDGKAEGILSAELHALNDEYAKVEQQVQQLDIQLDQQDDLPTEYDIAEALRTIEPLWAELFPAEKERIVRLLVETVTVRPDGLTIRLRPTGLITLAAEVGPEAVEKHELEGAIA